MRLVFDNTDAIQSKLHTELVEALGVDLIVQQTENGYYDESAAFVQEALPTLEVIVPDDVDEALIRKVVEAHDPTPEEPLPVETQVEALAEKPPVDEALLTKIQSASTIEELRNAFLDYLGAK